MAEQGGQEGPPFVVHGLHQAERLLPLLPWLLLRLRLRLGLGKVGKVAGLGGVGQAPLHAPEELFLVVGQAAVHVCTCVNR